MRKLNIKIKGFALFECMLALIIMALIAVAITNYYQSMLNQRKAQQVEFAFRSIFSGIFVYHENEGDWPKNVQDVIDNGYIVDKLSKNIWGNSYNYNLDDTHQLIKISTCVPSKGIAANIAAGLPMSQVVDHDKTCAQGVMLVAQMSYFKGSQSLKTYIVEANNIETQKIPKLKCKYPYVDKIAVLSIQPKDQFDVASQSSLYWSVTPKIVSDVTDTALVNTYCGTNVGADDAN